MVSSGNAAGGSVLGGLHTTHSTGARARGLSQEMHFTGSKSCLQHRGTLPAPQGPCEVPWVVSTPWAGWDKQGLDETGQDGTAWEGMGQYRRGQKGMGWDRMGLGSPHLLKPVARLAPQQGPWQRHCWVSLHTCSSRACRGASAAQSSCREGRGSRWDTRPISRDAVAPEGHLGHMASLGARTVISWHWQIQGSPSPHRDVLPGLMHSSMPTTLHG